jgi:uncharacterized protein (DUF362 family)
VNRREFLKKSLALAVGTSALLLPGKTGRALGAVVSGPADLAAVRGGEPEEMFDRGIATMGGMKRFVSKGQTVVVKPNMAWDVRPELGANTNPALVERIVRRCIEAGASKVYVFDHTCDLWKRSYITSGIEEAARRAGATVVPADQVRYYQKAPIAGARILKETLVHELVLQSDVFINVPVLKNHGGAGLTISMKNLMGIVWDRGEFHSRGLHQCIADLSLLRKPDLNVVDAYRVMTKSGPRGTSERDITIRKAQVLSTDIVAADAAAAKIFGTEPNSVEYIRQGEALKAGTMDLNRLKVERIAL